MKQSEPNVKKKKEEKILLTKKNLTGNFYTFFSLLFLLLKMKMSYLEAFGELRIQKRIHM